MGNGYKMKEIKFRGWDKKYKVMRPVIEYFRPFKHIKTEAGYISVIDEVGDEIFWRFGCPEIEQENFIVMQFTGLKDKNGVEIYEGDIVKYVAGENYENTGEVIWVDETNSFNFKTYPFMCGFVIHNEKENKTDKFEWDETNYMEVIGNIYEDLELLERENK